MTDTKSSDSATETLPLYPDHAMPQSRGSYMVNPDGTLTRMVEPGHEGDVPVVAEAKPAPAEPVAEAPTEAPTEAAIPPAAKAPAKATVKGA